MTNCFTFTYKKLITKGYSLPTEWNGFTTKDFRHITANSQHYLDEKYHIEFFKEICDEVTDIKEDDIIIHENGVGLALNQYKYLTILEGGKKIVMKDIKKEYLKFRLRVE